MGPNVSYQAEYTAKTWGSVMIFGQKRDGLSLTIRLSIQMVPRGVCTRVTEK